MNNKNIYIILVVIIVLFIIGIFAFMFYDNIKFKNGYEIIYKIENKNKSKVSKDNLLEMKNYFRTLINRYIITETDNSNLYDINTNNNKIIIKMKNKKYIDGLRKQLSSKSHNLTFRDINDNILMDSSVLRINDTKISTDTQGNPAISLPVKNKDKFYDVTKKLAQQSNNLLVIWLDFDEKKDSYQNEGSSCGTSESNCLSAATVSQGFASDVIIQGNFSFEEANGLVDKINSGVLPVKIKEISCKKI